MKLTVDTVKTYNKRFFQSSLLSVLFFLGFNHGKMTLPLHYNSATEYFEKALSFLKEYDWLYNYPNTHIFVNKVLERIPPQWVSYHQNLSNEKLKDFAEGFVDVCERSHDVYFSLNLFLLLGNHSN